jgi:predicted alpha/beta hydrolase
VLTRLLVASALGLFLSITPAAACEVVQFETSDGVQLEADWCPAADLGSPLLVLMHMIPPHHSRANYPEAVRKTWVDAGFSVLNVDRRGAGESKGNAKEAYKGPKGKLDVAAALAFAGSKGAAVSKWGCVGASNGTTSCLDFAVHAAGDDAVSGPSALVFMTGGTYTEAQSDLSKSVATSLPVLFTFNEKEKAWSEGAGAGAKWERKSYSPGGHGTLVFGPNPEAATDIAAFLKKALQ